MIVIDEKRNIRVSKGDSVNLNVKLQDDTLSAGETIKFAVKATANNDKELISITIDITEETDEFTIPLEHEDFTGLAFGTYTYDIVRINGTKTNRLFFPASFTIVEVVANV